MTSDQLWWLFYAVLVICVVVVVATMWKEVRKATEQDARDQQQLDEKLSNVTDEQLGAAARTILASNSWSSTSRNNSHTDVITAILGVWFFGGLLLTSIVLPSSITGKAVLIWYCGSVVLVILLSASINGDRRKNNNKRH